MGGTPCDRRPRVGRGARVSPGDAPHRDAARAPDGVGRDRPDQGEPCRLAHCDVQGSPVLPPSPGGRARRRSLSRARQPGSRVVLHGIPPDVPPAPVGVHVTAGPGRARSHAGATCSRQRPGGRAVPIPPSGNTSAHNSPRHIGVVAWARRAVTVERTPRMGRTPLRSGPSPSPRTTDGLSANRRAVVECRGGSPALRVRRHVSEPSR